LLAKMRERETIRTVVENPQETEGISGHCLQIYRRKMEYHNTACKATEEKGILRIILVILRGKEGMR
jgi:hypothetical protein